MCVKNILQNTINVYQRRDETKNGKPTWRNYQSSDNNDLIFYDGKRAEYQNQKSKYPLSRKWPLGDW